jgi:hypothetical protein
MKKPIVRCAILFGIIYFVVSCSVSHTNIQNIRPFNTNSNVTELGQVGTVLTRAVGEGNNRIQERAYIELLRVAREKFPDWPIVDVRAINIESFDEGDQKNILTATGTVVVFHRSKLLTPLEKATEDALLVALENASIPANAKISIHSARIANAEIGNKSFDTIEQTVFNLGFTNIVDRLDMNITRSEQDLRAGFESNDQSLAGFFLGADYIITVRAETNRTTVRILDAKTSTVIGRSSRWY